MNKTAGRLTGGAAALLGAAALAFYLREAATEHAGYTVEQADGVFEIRRYPALLVAETALPGGRKVALNTGFRRLARYIFAEDRPDGDRRKIAMTAPVLSDQAGGRWRTRFVLPRGLAAADLPQPGPEVSAETLPSRRLAAIRFSGRGTDDQLQSAERDLRGWLLGRGLSVTGPAEYAFYNSPFIPGPLRRNEVLLPIA